MRVVRMAILLGPALLSGCIIVPCEIPIVAKDAIWDDAAPVTRLR
jgi:hypothetical protein